ncbi:helix-turn-helix domain-containing protein [Shewanella oncorhynchi]|uniref:Helix-turn-helix domain-containing protein n=1 Tax=Shewanella oncorhynchi TaxID=2726434 RepID=A0AA50KGK8_9GAMM|nr:helix-turn-helix domain-containing protein [Shewanella oncorhynchi]WMB74207.1 helix-turn-helix domain-containing protein [Shewanella oncorhynchi]
MKTQFDITKTIIGTPAKALNLTQREKNLFIYLSHFFGLSEGQWKCYPSLATLSELSGTKKSDISTITNKLVSLGYIEKESRYDNSVIYTFKSLTIQEQEEVEVTVVIPLETPENDSETFSTEVDTNTLPEPEDVIQDIVVETLNQDFRSWNESQPQIDYAAIAQTRLNDRYDRRPQTQTISSFSNLPY